jgi:hypothetical protein
MASHPNIKQVTSFAEILDRLKANPVKAQREWHKRVSNSYRAGQPCSNCGQTNWVVGRKMAECGNPRCGTALLLEDTI